MSKFITQRLVHRVREVIQQMTGKFPPDQLANELGCPGEATHGCPDLAGTDLAKVQMRRESRGTGHGRLVPRGGVILEPGIDEALEPLERPVLARPPGARHGLVPADARHELERFERLGSRPALRSAQRARNAARLRRCSMREQLLHERRVHLVGLTGLIEEPGWLDQQ